jgi:putative transcriptional regulator
MNVYKSIMQGLTEAVNYQQGKITAKKTKLTIKPATTFNADDTKRIQEKRDLFPFVPHSP